jgi:hypothetical protein
MQRQWQIRRTTLEIHNGQQRWDQAYQLLLRWAQTNPSPAGSETPSALPHQEVFHASSHLCAGLDIPSSPAADD